MSEVGATLWTSGLFPSSLYCRGHSAARTAASQTSNISGQKTTTEHNTCTVWDREKIELSKPRLLPVLSTACRGQGRTAASQTSNISGQKPTTEHNTCARIFSPSSRKQAQNARFQS